MVKVKICGITNLEDALHAIECGADMLGFNFYEKSPRSIEPDRAAEIVQQLPAATEKVGIFVNAEEYYVAEYVEMIGLTVVQLHGDEDKTYIASLKTETDSKLIKALRVGPDFDIDSLSKLGVDDILLDAYSKDAYGGTGERFDWTTAATINGNVTRLYLAGGLTQDNVADAVRTVRPYAVDVASGVESSPGKKDPKKVEAFIRNAKNA